MVEKFLLIKKTKRERETGELNKNSRESVLKYKNGVMCSIFGMLIDISRARIVGIHTSRIEKRER